MLFTKAKNIEYPAPIDEKAVISENNEKYAFSYINVYIIKI